MYTPDHFKENDKSRLEALIKQNAFATLITTDNGEPFASHLPLLFDPSKSENGVLIGHMSRANAQWKSFKDTQNVLIIFQGANSYISRSWYTSPGFPTWNYSVAHVYGKPRVIHDESAIFLIIEQLTKKYEAQYKQPWAPNIPSEKLKMVVGFEIWITKIQGKYKLSQNRSIEDQRSVIKNLNSKENNQLSSVAELMEANLARNSNQSLNPTA